MTKANIKIDRSHQPERRFPFSIISRYICFSFLKLWSLALVGFIILYSAIDFLEKIGDFIGQGISLSTVALFFIAQLPKIIVMMTPVATLIAVLITLALMARASEIVAFKASGVSLYRLSAPLLMVSLGICLIMFLISDMVSPRTTAVANSIWQGQVKDRLNTSTTVSDVWLKDVRLIQHLDSYDEAEYLAAGVTLIFVDDDMDMTRRLEAKSGRFIAGQLRLNEVMDKNYSISDDGAQTFTLKRYPFHVLENWPPPPAGIGRTEQDSDELSTAQLWRTIDRLRAEGFSPVRQRVDLQFKFSFALLPFIMVVVGLPIGFWREKGGSVALGLAVGLGLSFVYLITMELARSLGYSGLLPALVTAWLPNLIFLLFGAYLFSYVRQ